MGGELPQGWLKKRIGEFAEVVGGGTPSTRDPSNFGGDIPWITPKDLSQHHERKIFRGERNLTKKGLDSSSAKLLPKDSVILSSRAPIGYVAIAGKSLATNQGCRNLVLKDSCSPEYVYYVIKTMTEVLKNHASGTTFGEISGSALKQIEVVLPPFPEQHRIASILGALDDKIELNYKINKTLEEMAQAIFKSWFVDFEPIQGGEFEYNEELGKEIPKGWEVKPIDEIADFLNGLALQKYPPNDENYLPVIKIRELRQAVTESSDRASSDIDKRYIVDDGDVLFSWSGSLEVCIWCGGKGALNQHLFKVTSQSYPKWFYYQWIKFYLPKFRHIAKGKATTMGHIRRHHLSETYVLIPPNKIIEKMNETMVPLMESFINNNIESRQLANIRDTLLPKLLSGEIRVNTDKDTEVVA